MAGESARGGEEGSIREVDVIVLRQLGVVVGLQLWEETITWQGVCMRVAQASDAHDKGATWGSDRHCIYDRVQHLAIGTHKSLLRCSRNLEHALSLLATIQGAEGDGGWCSR